MNNFTAEGAQTLIAVDTNDKKFTIDGDHVALYSITPQFLIEGSTGNDGWYTNAGVALVDGDTVITVYETISDSTVDGTIRNPILSNLTKIAFFAELTDRGLDMT